MKPGKTLTSAQVILLAANDLARAGLQEFSEWQLTEAAWKRDRNRFAMRGFESQYPDHKRVMKEIMGQANANPLRKGLLEKTRPNHYRLTPLGLVEVTRLDTRSDTSESGVSAAANLYDAVVLFADQRAFQSWKSDPAEPRSWLGASAFLQLSRNTPQELNVRLRQASGAIDRAIEWCESNERSQLNRGPVGGGRAISRDELAKLRSFLDLLQTRFAAQIGAIRARGSEHGR